MKICRKRQISSSYPAIHGRSLQGGLRRCIRWGWHLILWCPADTAKAGRLLRGHPVTGNVIRAIICCQAFHARRCRMYFEYVFQDREIEFLMCPAVTQGISRDNWAESKKGLETVLGELRRCGEQFSWMLQ